MKPYLKNLRLGQRVWALVEENIAQGEVIINFSGDLVRVLNQSLRPLRVGQRVLLQVEAISPIQLRLINKAAESFSNNLDAMI